MSTNNNYSSNDIDGQLIKQTDEWIVYRTDSGRKLWKCRECGLPNDHSELHTREEGRHQPACSKGDSQ